MPPPVEANKEEGRGYFRVESELRMAELKVES